VTPVFDVLSGVKLVVVPASPMINATNGVNPSTGYARSVFTVSGDFRVV
jgi:hypothetical protein